MGLWAVLRGWRILVNIILTRRTSVLSINLPLYFARDLTKTFFFKPSILPKYDLHGYALLFANGVYSHYKIFLVYFSHTYIYSYMLYEKRHY